MEPKDRNGLAATAALRAAECRLSEAVQCVARTMDTVDALHARVAELEATIRCGDTNHARQDETENPHCPYCGSNNVSCDAIASWVTSLQRWNLAATYDNGVCCDCEKEIKHFDWKESKDQKSQEDQP